MTLSDKLDEYNKGVSAWLDQAKKATAAIHKLERAVATGNLRDLEKLRQAAQAAAENAAQRGAECPSFEFDATEYLTQRQGFIEEFNRTGVRQVCEVGPGVWGILTAYRWPGNVRELENVVLQATSIRPETVAGMLKQAQSKEPKARPQQFIETLFDAYELVRAQRKIDAYIDQPLTRIYDVLTLLPGLDYTLLDFTRDIYFLDTSGWDKTRKGYLMSLTASTVSREKSVKVLQFVTREGYGKDYAAIRFSPPHKGD